ncbi:MAG: hypothetical protein EP343_21550 [Deltaproteobacteria bacterium]|nr:MAG: hypothetical protein EP343_21550 [Deltaproteobacteria bacterium]
MTAAKAAKYDAPMRVYALAKELDVPSKDLLAKLQDMGLDYASVQKNVSVDDINTVVETLTGSSKKKTTKKKATKKKATAKKATKKAAAEEEESKPKRGRKAKAEAEVEEEAPKKSSKKTASKKKTAAKKTSTKKKATSKKKTSTKKAVEEMAEAVASSPDATQAPADFAAGFLKAFLHTVQMEGTVSVDNNGENSSRVIVVSKDLLNFPNSEKLTDAVQQILQTAVGYHFDKNHTLVINWQKEEGKTTRSLEEMAVALAQQVAKLDKVLYIDALNSHERRVIHTTIAEMEGAEVQTHSDGYDIFRRMMIIPNTKQTPQRPSNNRGGDRDSRGGDRDSRGGDRDSRGGDRDSRGGDRDSRGGDRGRSGGDRGRSRSSDDRGRGRSGGDRSRGRSGGDRDSRGGGRGRGRRSQG